jgi:hypothetical protein
MPRKAKTLDQIFEVCDAIQPDMYGCRVYPGVTGWGGYWVVRIHRKDFKVHRLILERKLGRPIKPGWFALHTCDNPPCVNEDHLYEGTYKDNMRDKVERNLESWNYPRTEDQLIHIQQLTQKGIEARREKRLQELAEHTRWVEEWKQKQCT